MYATAVERIVHDDLAACLDLEELDMLPFASIELDRDGRVIAYSAAAAQVTHRDKEEALGRSFFSEVAPTTNNVLFRGRFDELRKRGGRIEFDYIFRAPGGDTRTRVQLRIGNQDHRWIFVLPAD